jgi:lipopolysaccharide exporter
VTNGKSLISQTAIGATWMMAWRLVTRLLGLASTLVLARVLTPADFGLLAMATTFAAAVEALSQLGLQDALMRHPDGERLMDAGFALQLGRGLATGLVIAAAAPGAAWWFDEPRLLPVLLVLAATSLVAGAENIGIIAFRRDMRFDKQFALLSGPRLLQVAVTIPLALVLHSYWALLAGIVVSRLARTAMTYVVHPYRPRLRLSGWRELAHFSLWTWLSALAGLVWDRCDPFVLGPQFGAGPLGIYLQALELASLPATELVVPAADALLAGFSSAQRQGTTSVSMAPVVSTALLTAILPLVITISCGASDVVAVLLGPKWTGAQDLVSILAWQGVFAPFAFVVGVTLIANGLVQRNFIANIIASAIKLTTLVTAVSLTRRLDIVAWAAVGCVACEAIVFLTMLPPGGGRQWRKVMGGFGRAMLAAGGAVFFLFELGLAWQPVGTAGLPALAHGMLIAGLGSAAYVLVILSAWLVAGRPEGPERDLFRLVLTCLG